MNQLGGKNTGSLNLCDLQTGDVVRTSLFLRLERFRTGRMEPPLLGLLQVEDVKHVTDRKP